MGPRGWIPGSLDSGPASVNVGPAIETNAPAGIVDGAAASRLGSGPPAEGGIEDSSSRGRSLGDASLPMTDADVPGVAGIAGCDSAGVLRVPRMGTRRRATYVRGSGRPSTSRAVGSAPLTGRAIPRAGE